MVLLRTLNFNASPKLIFRSLLQIVPCKSLSFGHYCETGYQYFFRHLYWNSVSDKVSDLPCGIRKLANEWNSGVPYLLHWYLMLALLASMLMWIYLVSYYSYVPLILNYFLNLVTFFKLTDFSKILVSPLIFNLFFLSKPKILIFWCISVVILLAFILFFITYLIGH